MNAIDILKFTTEEETTRYKHLTACYNQAKEMLSTINIDEIVKEKILNTVLLHDIGYSEKINTTNLHTLDGYNYLKNNYPEVCFHKVIALHGDFINICPKDYTDTVNDIYDSLSDLEFATLIILDYCDTHTDGYGNKVTLEERWSDLENRHKNENHLTKHYDDLKKYTYHVEKITPEILHRLPKLI